MKIVDDNTGRVISTVYGANARGKWSQLSTDVTIPGSDGTVSVILYAYASSSASVAQYRNARLEVWKAGSGQVAVLSGRLVRAHTAKAKAVGKDRYLVNIHNGTRVLVMSSSYTANWRAVANGHRLPHFMVDGDLNGWLLPRAYTGVVTVDYGPVGTEGWFELLMAISIGSLSVYGIIAWVGKLGKGRSC